MRKKQWRPSKLLVWMSVFGIVTLTGSGGGALVQPPGPLEFRPPLLPDGQPDMQGAYVPNWRTSVPIERWTDAEREAYRTLLSEKYDLRVPGVGFGESNLQGEEQPAEGTVLVVDSPDGKIPYQPWAAAQSAST